MAYEHKPNTGSTFVNDNREKETSCHEKGSALIAGVHYWVYSWVNETKDGKTWRAFQFHVKEEKTDQRPSGTQSRADHAASHEDEFDDTIPF